jgi:hypothetical protein
VRRAARFSFDQTAFPQCGSAVFASGAADAADADADADARK